MNIPIEVYGYATAILGLVGIALMFLGLNGNVYYGPVRSWKLSTLLAIVGFVIVCIAVMGMLGLVSRD